LEKHFQIAENTYSCLKLGNSCFTSNQVVEKKSEINTKKNQELVRAQMD